MYFQSELMIFEMDPSVVKFWIDSRHIIPTEMLLHSLLDYQINFECLVGLWEQNMLLMFADVFLYLTAVPWVLWIWYVIYVVHFSNFIQRTNYFYDLQNTNWTVRYGTLSFYVKYIFAILTFSPQNSQCCSTTCSIFSISYFSYCCSRLDYVLLHTVEISWFFYH